MVHVHVVRVVGPRFGFGHAGAVFGLGGDDAPHAHADDQQVLIVLPESLQFLVAEALAGA